MKKFLYNIAAICSAALLTLPFAGCQETESDLVSFVDDNKLNTPNDTVYSLMGIISKMQVVVKSEGN